MTSKIFFTGTGLSTIIWFSKANGENTAIGGVSKTANSKIVLLSWNQSPSLTAEQYLKIGNKLKAIEKKFS